MGPGTPGGVDPDDTPRREDWLRFLTGWVWRDKASVEVGETQELLQLLYGGWCWPLSHCLDLGWVWQQFILLKDKT